MILVRFWMVRVFVALSFLLGSSAMVIAQTPASEGKVPRNEGGVLTFHHYAGIDASRFDGDCSLLTFEDFTDIEVQVPGDGTPQLIAIHMSFPSDQPVAVSGTTFGIDFSENVFVVKYGFCKTTNGILLPDGLWPRPETNIGIYFGPAETRNHAVVAWFVVTCEGDGSFTTIPHADGQSGAAFANLEPAPHLAAITGFGGVGFGATRGVVPTAGQPLARGICCISELCTTISELSCDYYGGLYLGRDSDCDSGPCREDALQGACCLLDGCTLLTRRDCYIEAGQFLGEGTTCDEADCAGIWVDGGDE